MAIFLSLLARFWYAIPILLLVVALGVTRARLADVRDERDLARAFSELVIDATRDAAGNPELARESVPAQIAALGRSVKALGDGLERCNATSRAHAENDARRSSEAEAALAAARRRAAAGDATIARLRASAGQPRSPESECEPSQTVEEIWR
jgi:hypothetical protein